MKLASLQASGREWAAQGRSSIEIISINAGQHYDHELATQYHEEYGLSFEVDLTDRHMTTEPIAVLASMIVELTHELKSIGPTDYVMVFGDANTTLAGAIAARRLGRPLVHVEAGLRTYDAASPEESNRVVADHLAAVHFTSSRVDASALELEGISSSIFTGDLIRDLVTRFNVPPRRAIQRGTALVTIHREENTRDSSVIDETLSVLAARGFQTVFVMHPRLKEGSWVPADNVNVRSSLPHSVLLELLQSSEVVISDSGALQRESYYLGRQILICQDRPFWRSLVDAGYHRVVRAGGDDLKSALDWAESVADGDPPKVDDFGDGFAGHAILSALSGERLTLG